MLQILTRINSVNDSLNEFFLVKSPLLGQTVIFI